MSKSKLPGRWRSVHCCIALVTSPVEAGWPSFARIGSQNQSVDHMVATRGSLKRFVGMGMF